MFSFLGTFIPLKYYDQAYGKHFLYEIGGGTALINTKETSIVVLIECNGRYFQKNKTAISIDQNSGGNIIFLGSGLLFRHNNFAVDLAIQGPLLQHLNGNQEKRLYRLAFQALWAF